VPRLTLRVVGANGARGNSPAYGQVQTVRVLYSVHSGDARRGTMGIPKAKRLNSGPVEKSI